MNQGIRKNQHEAWAEELPQAAEHEPLAHSEGSGLDDQQDPDRNGRPSKDSRGASRGPSGGAGRQLARDLRSPSRGTEADTHFPQPSPRGPNVNFFPCTLSEWNPTKIPAGDDATSRVSSSLGMQQLLAQPVDPRSSLASPGSPSALSFASQRPSPRSGSSIPRRQTSSISSSQATQSAIGQSPLLRVLVFLPGSGCVGIKVDARATVGPNRRKSSNPQEMLFDDTPEPPLSLKESVEVATNVPIAAQKLVLRVFGPLDDDSRPLSDYGFRDGTQLTLSIKNGAVLGREGARGHQFLSGPGLLNDRAAGHGAQIMEHAANVAGVPASRARGLEVNSTMFSASSRASAAQGGRTSVASTSTAAAAPTPIPMPQRFTNSSLGASTLRSCIGGGASSDEGDAPQVEVQVLPTFGHHQRRHHLKERDALLSARAKIAKAPESTSDKGNWRAGSSRVAAMASHATRGRLKPTSGAGFGGFPTGSGESSRATSSSGRHSQNSRVAWSSSSSTPRPSGKMDENFIHLYLGTKEPAATPTTMVPLKSNSSVATATSTPRGYMPRNS